MTGRYFGVLLKVKGTLRVKIKFYDLHTNDYTELKDVVYNSIRVELEGGGVLDIVENNSHPCEIRVSCDGQLIIKPVVANVVAIMGITGRFEGDK